MPTTRPTAYARGRRVEQAAARPARRGRAGRPAAAQTQVVAHRAAAAASASRAPDRVGDPPVLLGDLLARRRRSRPRSPRASPITSRMSRLTAASDPVLARPRDEVVEAAVGLHHVGDRRRRAPASCSIVPASSSSSREVLAAAVLGHPGGRLRLDQQAELVEVAQQRLGLALATQRLLHDGAEDVPVLGRADLGALAVLDVHHPEHRERLHRLARDGAADAEPRSRSPRTEGNASPTPIRPETISAASSVESCSLRRCGSRRPVDAAASRSAGTDAARDERQLRRDAARAAASTTSPNAVGGRAQPGAARERRAGRGRAWRTRCSGRSSAASRTRASAGLAKRSSARALSPARLGLVDADEQVDQVDAGNDPAGAAAQAVEEVDAAVAAPDRELGAELARSSRSSRPGPASSLTRRTFSAGCADPPHELGPEPDAEVGGRVLDHHRQRDGRRDADEVVDERRVAEGAAHRRGHDDAARAGRSAWRASSIEARRSARRRRRTPGTAPATSSTITSVSCRRSSAESFSTSPARPKATMPWAPHVEREADDPPLRLEVDRVVRGERRADRGIDPAPRVGRRSRPIASSVEGQMLTSISSEITSEQSLASDAWRERSRSSPAPAAASAGRSSSASPREGAAVVASQRAVDEGEELARSLDGRRAARSRSSPADVRDERDAERLVAETVARFGRVDVLCNNAGVGLLEVGHRDRARRVRPRARHEPLGHLHLLAPRDPAHGRARAADRSSTSARSRRRSASRPTRRTAPRRAPCTR